MEDQPDPPIDDLMDQLIPEARAVAWRYWHAAPYVLEFDELVSLAHKGLVEARHRWERYCAEHAYSPERTRYFKAYAHRRMNGSILDAMRGADWVTRSVRNRARALREAGQDQGRSEAEMATRTGMSVEQVDATLAAMNRRPVQFDPAEHDLPSVEDTESAAVASDLLARAVQAMRDLPHKVQFVLLLTFYSGYGVREAAAALGMPPAEAAALQQEGVLAVHAVLARAAGDGGSRGAYQG